MQKVGGGRWEQHHTSQSDDLEEMDKFLGTDNLPRRNHEETEKSNDPRTRNETESVIQNLPTKKSPGSHGLLGDSRKTVQKRLM